MTRPDPHVTAGDRIAEALRRRLVEVERLAELSRRQAGAIAEADSDTLLRLVSERQTIVDQLMSGAEELGALAATMARTTAPEDRRAEIRELADAVGSRIAEIMARDREDARAINAVKDRIRAEIQQVGTGRQATQAYRRRIDPQENRFADRRA